MPRRTSALPPKTSRQSQPRPAVQISLDSRLSSPEPARWPKVACPGYGPAELVSFATILGWASISGREADLAGGRGIVAGQLLRALPQPPFAEKPDQGLHGGPKVAALAHREVKILPDQRHEIEPGRARRRARRDAAIGLSRA